MDVVTEFEETVRQIKAIFDMPRAVVDMMLERLRVHPLPEELAVWESEGGTTR